MSSKNPCRREFSQFMSYHIFGNKNLMKHFAVIDHKRKTHKLRNYRTSSHPRLDWLTRTGLYLPVDLGKKLLINIRPFFKRSTHFSASLVSSSFTTPGASTGLIVPTFYFYVFE